jgi:putative DNA primase/helicase
MKQDATRQPLIIDQRHLEEGQTYPIHHFLLRREGLYMNVTDKETGEVSAFKISEPMFVKETVQNLDTKDVYVKLCYRYKGKFHEIEIGMGQLIPSELLKLSGKGLDVSHEYHKLVATFLREQQKLTPHREVYREVGWHEEEDGNLVFRHHHVLSKEAKQNIIHDIKGGFFNLEPNGSLDAWKRMIEEEVKGNTPLEMIVCAGFSSVLVGYLSRFYDEVDTLLIHLAGDSTKGKTTAALLAVSIMGMPSNKKKGLQKTWNGTSNAIINMMSGNYGIPIVLDELSMSHAKSLTSELYVLTAGQEKSRLNDEMKQRKQGTWATTILSTGEQSIFERTSQNVGLTVRAFDFSNITWTSSAANADAIRKVIQNNYGHAGIAFIQYLFDSGLHIIEETWEKWQAVCLEALPDSPFRTRIAKKYAIILAAGDIANQSLSLSLDLESILSFLVEEEKERMIARDIGAKAFQHVTQLFIQHQANFRREGSIVSPANCWGKMFIHRDYVEVAFLKHILEQELRKGGFDDPKVVIRSWKEKDWLVTEGDRPTKRTKIFENSEQEERKKVLGTANVPKKLQDTTYNIKLPLEALKGLISQQPHPLELDEIARSWYGF